MDRVAVGARIQRLSWSGQLAPVAACCRRRLHGARVGRVVPLCVVRPGVVNPRRFDDIITPFSGYSDLLPFESLRTLHDLATDYADPDDPEQADAFPQGGERMIALARWYRETLFLDYRDAPVPRVGFVDFDHEDWSSACRWWPDFESFFVALREFKS